MNFKQLTHKIRRSILEEFKTSDYKDIYFYLFQSEEAKFLRPIIFYIIVKFKDNYDDITIIKLASAIEMIHVASLIHDDIMDSSVLRRNIPSLNIKFGENVAVLAGDYIFTKAINIIVKFGNLAVIEEVSSCVNRMTEGQIKEILLSNPSKQDYLEIAEKKTASLFETSAKIAALINFSYDKKLINYLSDYGRFFGIAFQITDDILDNSTIPFKDIDEAKAEVFFYINKAQESLRFITNKNKALLLDLTEELKNKLK